MSSNFHTPHPWPRRRSLLSSLLLPSSSRSSPQRQRTQWTCCYMRNLGHAAKYVDVGMNGEWVGPFERERGSSTVAPKLTRSTTSPKRVLETRKRHHQAPTCARKAQQLLFCPSYTSMCHLSMPANGDPILQVSLK